MKLAMHPCRFSCPVHHRLRCTHSLSVVKRVSVHPNVDACVGYVQYMMLANAIAFVDGEMIYLAKPRGGSLGSIQISR
jgi:hypothetical protein